MMPDLDDGEVCDVIIALRVYAKKCREWSQDGSSIADHWQKESERCHALSNKIRQGAYGLEPKPL